MSKILHWSNKSFGVNRILNLIIKFNESRLFYIITFISCISYFTYGFVINDTPHIQHSNYLELDKNCIINDTLFVGYMYWSIANTFSSRPDLIISGVIRKINPIIQSENHEFPAIHSGVVTVKDILWASSKYKEISRSIKFISGSCFTNLRIGDTMVTRLLEYEGCLASPGYSGNNSGIGIRVSRNDEINLNEITTLFKRNNPWDITKLSKKEIELWKLIDPDGYWWESQIIEFTKEDQ